MNPVKIITGMSRGDLMKVPLPKRTDSYTPIAVSEIFDVVDTLTEKHNFTLHKEILETKRENNQQKMRFVFDLGDPNLGFELAILNSYDKTIAFKSGAGSTAYICWNLQVMAENRFAHKHTGVVDEMVYEYLKNQFTVAEEMVVKAQKKWDFYNSIELSPKQIHELVGKMVLEDNLLQAEQFNMFRKSMIESPIKYENLTKDSLNQLFQHTTYAVRETAPINYFGAVNRVFSKFDEYAELITEDYI